MNIVIGYWIRAWLKPEQCVNYKTERWRWPIAGLLDLLPGTCWADLAVWAMGYRNYEGYSVRDMFFPKCKIKQNTTCWCGKNKIKEAKLYDEIRICRKNKIKEAK